jgi:hypothetical protein
VTLIHIAAQPIQVGAQLRQRCGWCGAVLLDYPLDRMAVPVDQAAEGPATWETGVLVGVHGGVHWLVDHVDGEKLPPEACAQLPHDVTGATP